MQAGKMDRLVQIERPVQVRDLATGETSIEYQIVDRVWGSKTPGPAQERLSEGQIHTEPRDTIRIRYRDDIAAPGSGPAMRLTVEGATGDIVDVTEVGRREALDLTILSRGEP